MAARRVYAEGPLGPDGGDGAGDRVPDLVVVGAASRDVAPDDARGWRLGGPATYASLAAARLGLRVGCLLGVDELAARARELTAHEVSGVDLRRVPLANGPVFENIQRGDRREQRWGSRSDRVPIEALPEAWRDARGWLLGPVAGELDAVWAGIAGPGALVGLGWQGLLREFRPDGTVARVVPAPDALVRAADLVVASVDDVAPESAVAALRGFLGPGATLVLTAGNRGGMAFTATGQRRYPAIDARTLDPTGAGDVFLAALMAAWLVFGQSPASPRALRLAAAAASRSVEGLGLSAVPTTREVADRMRGG